MSDMTDKNQHEESSALSRRKFLAMAGGALLAADALAASAVKAAEGKAEEKPNVTAENVTFKSGDATIGAFLCSPPRDGKFPGVIVIHENRGLTDYIRDVTKQLAGAGYVALAVNLVSRKLGANAAGGTDEAMAALRELTTEQAIADLGAGIDYLKAQAFVRAEKIGSVGFCYGGRLSLLLACHRPDLSASVIFYGRPADALPLIPKIKAAVLGNFGGEDRAIPAETVKELEAELQKNGVTHDIKIFAGAGHAFHRPDGDNFKADAAQEAWQRTLNWFAKYLKDGNAQSNQ